MAKVLGRATIAVGGEYIETEPGAELDPGGIVGEPVETGYATHRAEKRMPAELKAVTVLKQGQSLEALRSLFDVEVVFTCDTGQVYVVRGAFQVTAPKITDGQGGKIPVELTGEPAEEVTVTAG